MKTRVFDLMAAAGYKNDTHLARAMGLSLSTVRRVRLGQRGINRAFVEGARRAFPDKSLDELFVVESETREAVPA